MIIQIHCFGCGEKSPVQEDPTLLCPSCCTLPKFQAHLRTIAAAVMGPRLRELDKENNTLRGLVANSELPCVYCKLSKEDMSKCLSGFPGCGRADDIMSDPNFQYPDFPEEPK